MGRHSNAVVPQQVVVPADGGGSPLRRPAVQRRRSVLPTFAASAALAFVLVSVTSPMAQNEAAAAEITAQLEQFAPQPAASQLPAQELSVAGAYDNSITRDGFSATAPPPPPPPPPVPTEAPSGSSGSGSGSGSGFAPPAGTPDPGSAQAIAYEMVMARGWGESEYSCLVSLWKKESGWNAYAMNKSSGAYGIPQSLPGNKMASAGADWATNPATQITWGLGYIDNRYGSPCGAWAHSQRVNWY